MTSATAAYRKDLEGRSSAFGERDGDWISVASLVSHAAEYNGASDEESEAKRVAWEKAIDVAITALGASELDRLAAREWGAGWSDADPLTLLSIGAADSGARHLPTLILDGVLRVRSGARDLAYGRTLAQRARMAHFAPELDVAEDLYRQVDELGRNLESAELQARAANGFVSLAQKRGNHPEMLRAATRGLELAEQTAIPRVRWNARYSIMLSSALFKKYDDALTHGWALFNLVRGDEQGEGTALNALGQLLFEMGDIDSARAAFSSAVSRPLHPYRLLASLGSLAQIAALSANQSSTLSWAVAEVERFREAWGSTWAYGSALLDCAEALRDSGDAARARVLRDEVVKLAATHRFHALEHRAESLDLKHPTPALDRAPIHTRGIEVVSSLRELAPCRLPRHVRMATVGA